jgi:hypothetical protein
MMVPGNRHRGWQRLPLTARAIIAGLAIALVAANVWPALLAGLGVPITAAAEMIFLQDPSPASALATASVETETFVREALHDRLLAGDIPDIQLIRRAEGKPVFVRAELPESRLQITSRALPSVAGTELSLITLAEARQVVSRTGQPLHLIAIDHIRVEESTAALWLGVDLLVPTGILKMCCCEREAQFKKRDSAWVFERWGTGGRCY